MEIPVKLAVQDRVNHVDDPHELGIVSKRRVKPTRFAGWTDSEIFVVEYYVEWDKSVEDNDWFSYAGLVKHERHPKNA